MNTRLIIGAAVDDGREMCFDGRSTNEPSSYSIYMFTRWDRGMLVIRT